MTWEVKEGKCAECGDHGTWLEMHEFRQLPEGWFYVDFGNFDTPPRIILCSVRCVQARVLRLQAPVPSSSSPSRPPE